MPKFSIIIPVLNENALLPKALDSLIHQTSENFEAIIVDGGSDDGSVATAEAACDRYVGFYLIKDKFSNRFEALNRGIAAAEGDYIMFLSAHDFITDETVEQLEKQIDESEHKPDIVVFRNYLFGDGIMPHFSEYDDKLAPIPSVPKYDNLLLRSFTLGNKCYRKSFLENRKIFFGTDGVYEDYYFIYRAFVSSKLTCGCPYAFYEKRVNSPSEGLEKRNEPTKENFISFSKMFADIYRLASEMLSEDSDTEIDGDESYLQEVKFRYISMLYERFYRFLWFMDNETYSLFADEYNRCMQTINDEKQAKLKKIYGYLGAPYIFEFRDKIDCLFTLILDFSEQSDYISFLDSLYFQTFPFFNVAVRKTSVQKDMIPEKYLNMPNVYVIEDKDYYTLSRQNIPSRLALVVKDPKPMGCDVLKELCASHSPAFLRQSVFAKIRKSSELKRSLKEKGLNI